MTTTNNHCAHSNSDSKVRPYRGAVSVSERNPAADGGIRIEEECPDCGAWCTTNSNGGHLETTGWVQPGGPGEDEDEECEAPHLLVASVPQVGGGLRRIYARRLEDVRRLREDLRVQGRAAIDGWSRSLVRWEDWHG